MQCIGIVMYTDNTQIGVQEKRFHRNDGMAALLDWLTNPKIKALRVQQGLLFYTPEEFFSKNSRHI